MSLIGKSVNRVDAFAKVTGEALYPGDINYPDQLYMKILFAGRPHAIVRSIDTTLAKELDQVVAVFTAEDVPMNEYGLILPDQPVLCGPGSSNPYGDRVRFIGDQIALVVAESEAIASKAIKLIDVDYHDLPVISDPIQAMKEGSVKIHPERDSNLLHKYRIRMGDMNAGWAQADVIVEGNYRTPFQEHAYLQPEAGLGYIDEKGRVTVVVGGQWTHEDQEQIAHALDIPQDQVRVIYPAIGGAFGGREDMSVQIVLALATWKLHQRGIDRPVKVIWSREESILGHHKRHPYILHARWGATKAGKLVAVEMDVVADGGAYAYTSTKVLGNATLMCVGPYEVPNVKVDTSVVYTNNIPCGAFRGFGGPQGAFASETQMNKLAEKLRMDPVKIRKINAIRDGSILSVGSPPPKGVTLSKVIEVCADSYDKLRVKSLEESSPIIKRGIGFACAFKNVGFSFGAPEECWATIELRGDAEVEEVILYHAASEVGQGTHTALAQMAAAATNVPMEKVRLEYSDTAITDNSGSVSASRMTFMAGNAIHGAAKIALEQWQSEERPAVGKYRYLPPKTTPLDPETGRSERPNFAYGYVAEAAVVEVDSETGHVHILDLVCVDDVGQVINRQQVVGQIEGAVVQAGGYTILENFVHRDGLVQTPNFSTYLIPGVLDIPDEVHSVILEYADPEGPWGARGMAEMPYLPLAPAVIAAVRDATGVWFDEFPLTPERVLKGLGKI